MSGDKKISEFTDGGNLAATDNLVIDRLGINYRITGSRVVTSNSAITGATKTKITYDAKGLVTNGVDATTTDFAQATITPSNSAAANADTQETLNNKFQGQINNRTHKYTSTFNATTDWGSASGGLYTISIPAATHGFGTVTGITFYETITGTSSIVMPDTVSVDDTTQDVSFSVSENPEGRFEGKVILLGII